MYRDFTDEFDDPHDAYLAWLETITQNHERRIRVRVMNPNHKTIAWLDDVLDGQVTISVENRNCTRVGSLRLLDPTQTIGMEPDDPTSLPIHLRRMVQVFYDVRVPGYGWMGPSVICGPVVDFDRTGAEVALSINGKEKLALGSFGHSHTWKKGRTKVAVIREILILAGEDGSRIHLPPWKNTLHKPFNVSRTDKPLVKARQLARGMGAQLWPDGRGHWRMRKIRGTEPVLPYINRQWLLGPVSEDRPELKFFNGWIVNGENPRGPKPQIRSDLIGLPEDHPFSAQSLQRNGKDFWQIKEIDRPGVKTKKRANEIARKAKDDHIESNIRSSVEMLPLPNIEEWDLLRAVDPLTGPAKVRVKEATIPLVSGNMTIGAVHRVSRGGKDRGWQPPIQGGL